ncbi:MAG: hypothetical protein Q9174_002469 [Haloplaca sp. 1 TL-2023]
MPFLQTLFLASSLSAATFAAPSNLVKRDREVTGVVPQGVNCATANEPLHSLSADTLTEHVLAGINYADPGSQGRLFPAEWDPATRINPAFLGITWAKGCNPAEGLYQFPVAYEGGCLPRIFMSTSKQACDGPETPDIVVFNVAFSPSPATSARKGSIATSAKYCGTFTNSDAPVDIKEVAGLLGGYRQCFNNVA